MSKSRTTVPTERSDVGWRATIGYGAGDAANNLSFMMVTSFLLVYYTDVAGISAAAAGTLFLVMRVFDAFIDLFAGRIIDSTKPTRFGKFRPYIGFGSLPLLLITAAVFSVPQIGETGILLYAYVTYALFGIAYTFVNIAYGSLAAAMTQQPGGRARLATARSIGGAIVSSLLVAILSPMLSKENDLQAVFSTAVLVFIFVGAALYAITFFTTKETVYRSPAPVTTKASLRILATNRPLILLCVSSVLLLVAQLSKSTASIYFMRDVFDALYLMPFLSLGQLAVIFIVGPFVPKVVRRFGKRNTYIGAGLLASGFSVVAFLAPNEWVAVGALLISLPAVMMVNIVIWALEADTVEYGEWKTGVRAEGITYATFSFTRQAGQAIGGALAAYSLALTGYVGAAAEQTVEAQWGIRAAAALLPAVATFLAAAIMCFYPLTDKRHAEILVEIRQRRGVEGEPGLSTAALTFDEADRVLTSDTHNAAKDDERDGEHRA